MTSRRQLEPITFSTRHHLFLSSLSLRNTVFASGLSGRSGNASRNRAITDFTEIAIRVQCTALYQKLLNGKAMECRVGDDEFTEWRFGD
jgi:hypothetical protein